ncbi:MAG: CRISPR-associated helicase Cas3' [Desulfotomaculales bacterium]
MNDSGCKCPEWLQDIWAKSPAEGENRGQSLAEHTWGVLTRLRDLARLRPWLPEVCGLPQLWHIMFWAALFHDWGKAARGFQQMLRGKGRWPHRHEVLSLVFLEWALPASEIPAVAMTILSHHRDPAELERLYPPGLPLEEDPLVELVQELDESFVRGLWRWLRELVPAWIVTLGFEKLGVRWQDPMPQEEAVRRVEGGAAVLRRLLNGYGGLVRALQDEVQHPWILKGLLLRGSMLQADHAASALTGPISEPTLTMPSILGSAELVPERLYPHQRSAAEVTGSALLVAPTGSGKTEAALLWAARQALTERGLPRLFYVLPYQASMNAMYDRFVRSFPGQVGLLHSRSVLALYRRLMERQYEPEKAAREARWARNLARLHYYPIGIFSPYQMLKAVYRLKGYEALLADFAGGAFVFDEIHAYEPARLALILETVRYLRDRLGCRFLVMSATMPRPVWRRVGEALGTCEEIVASDEVFHAFTRHRLFLLEGELLDGNALCRVTEAFREGKSVLVACNTVSRAQEAYRRLRAQISPEAVVLVHGRFNGRDRLLKEREILAATGVGSRHRRQLVVVATQVVEVSLNIDLDVIFSDPAPLEALIQRFGRVNRKRRTEIPAPVYVFTEPCDGQGVYLKELVTKTLGVLQKNAQGRPVNEAAVQGWLDEVYAGEVLARWEADYGRVATEFGRTFLDTLRPFDSDASLEEAFDRLFDGTEVLPACLWQEYRALSQERPLEASELLVPVSWGRWHQLRREGLVRSREGEWPPVVEVEYSSDTGLDFDVSP